MSRSQNASAELTEVLNKLWRLDTNRLKPGTDYIISPQGQAGHVAKGRKNAKDKAKEPLFNYVNTNKLKHIKTYAHFMNLLNNHKMSTGVGETVTPEEKKEIWRFINAIVRTKVMKCAHKYLVKKSQSPSYIKDFKNQLYNIWFKRYPKERGMEDCGFEHVFVGEIINHKGIVGLHNWVQFYLQEKLGHIDYKGYKAQGNKDTPDEDDHVLNLQFSCFGLIKPVDSFFIGVSPEFEVALFTIVFLMSNKKTSVVAKIDEYNLELVVYRHGGSIVTCFPKLLSSDHRDL